MSRVGYAMPEVHGRHPSFVVANRRMAPFAPANASKRTRRERKFPATAPRRSCYRSSAPAPRPTATRSPWTTSFAVRRHELVGLRPGPAERRGQDATINMVSACWNPAPDRSSIDGGFGAAFARRALARTNFAAVLRAAARAISRCCRICVSSGRIHAGRTARKRASSKNCWNVSRSCSSVTLKCCLLSSGEQTGARVPGQGTVELADAMLLLDEPTRVALIPRPRAICAARDSCDRARDRRRHPVDVAQYVSEV